MAHVANCPRCHEGINTRDMLSDAARVSYIAGQLVGHVFVLDTMMHHPAYANAVEGYNERVAEMISVMENWVHDLQEWGNAYDDEAEEEDAD